MNTRTISAAPLVLVSSVAVAASDPAEQELFRDLSLADALSAAEDEGRMLLVHNTAVWCGPCKMMERDTYTDARVESYFANKLVAIKVDVDEQAETAAELGIRAMPTMIVFKEGERFDEHVGYMSADDMLEWLGNVEAGKSSRVAQREALKAAAGNRELGPDGKVDVRERRNLARTWLQARNYDLATAEYVWLWSNMLEHDITMVGVRSSFMAREMESLAARYKPAMNAFTKLRDDAEARLKMEPSWDDLGDWITLNLRVLNERQPVLAWVDRNNNDQGMASLKRFDYSIRPMLIEERRWDVLGHLYQSAAGHVLEATLEHDLHPQFVPPGADDQMRKQLAESADRDFVNDVAPMLVAFVMTDQIADAAAAAELAHDRVPTANITAAVRHLLEASPEAEAAFRALDPADWPEPMRVLITGN
ncbi:MAG: thioredoxin family protein [Planctomycetota bacterium]